MIDTRVVSQELQDKIFDQLRKGQEQVRKGQETVTEAIKSWTATAQAIAPQLSDLPSWTARLPKPEELVAQLMAAQKKSSEQLMAAQKKSSEQLMAAQKKFAEQARDAVAPLLAMAGVSPARSGGKPASLSTATKAGTTKTSTAGTGTTGTGAATKASSAKKAATAAKPSTAKK
jgi:hypothetical protein